MFSKKIMLLSLLAGCAFARADTESAHAQELETIVVKGKRIGGGNGSALPFKNSRKASDVVIDGQKFKTRSATLGNALAGELGVHSNPFGGGASAPVIRGQEGVRVKILQNGADVVDMSSLSPDHAVAADTLLAQQVELVRGTSTLLYAAASPAGVVNIADKRIPDRMPAKILEGEAALRIDSASKETAATVGINAALGKQLALRAEGLFRRSDNYRVPGIKLGGDTLNYVPDTHNRSKVGTIGLSWIGQHGYLGASYSHRRDQYGLPGHNHMFDHCSSHFFNETSASLQSRKYLFPYPHLMDDSDLISSIHFHCGNEQNDSKPHSHDNVYGHDHDPSGGGPWVDMSSKRYDLRGEWRQPVRGVDKLKISLTHSDYYHDELHDGKAFISRHDNEHIKKRKLADAEKAKGKPESMFANKGWNARFELYHSPFHGLQGVFGAQWQTQTSYAKRTPPDSSDSNSMMGERSINERNPLVENTNKQFSLFALEQFRWRNFLFEAGARWEQQRIPIRYNQELLSRYVQPRTEKPDLSAYAQKALSYSGTLLWDFHPDYRLSLSASHNERLPTPMELYYHGKHLATNSFAYGNKNLQKERSDNYEIGLRFAGEQWDYKISTYYSRFKNYIYNENLYRSGNLFARRYTQSQARFYGLEGEIGYRFAPQHRIALFGDVVRGRLFGLPSIVSHNKIYRPAEEGCTYIDEEGLEQDCEPEFLGYETIHRPDRHAPRVPPARIGLRLNSEFNENWSASLEYTRVFAQNRVARSVYATEKRKDEQVMGEPTLVQHSISEDPSGGYHLLNAGISYHKHVGKTDYKLSLDVFNLLNEKVYIHNSHLPYVPQPGRNFMLSVNMNF